ncbi:hypothetical protein [Rhizobium sp. BK376]|uniref:hypothetical protein n=1 Tax=Rhizobium sp. BK376 TaxID=2512149 RepID=UPI0010538121|nr:hypothetical protein [Rhizobium sp. BK376]
MINTGRTLRTAFKLKRAIGMVAVDRTKQQYFPSGMILQPTPAFFPIGKDNIANRKNFLSGKPSLEMLDAQVRT